MKNLLLITIATMLFLGACKREPVTSNPTVTYHRLTQSQLNKTPYFTNPSFDTLTFLSNKGDTLIFKKLRTDTTWYYFRTQGAPGVTISEDYYQTLHNTYQTLKGNGKFEVRQELEIGSEIYFNFNNVNFEISDHQIGRTSYPTFREEFQINNKVFKNVLTMYQTFGDTSSNEAFLNQQYGIFYFKNKLINNSYILINE
jgi:hypothetical protein